MLPESDDFTNTEWHPQSWMHDLRSFIGEMAITQLCLLGSHDAASYGIRKDSPFGADAPGFLLGDSVLASLSRFLFRGICASWSKCQGMSVRAQLDYGVRYLDLRVATNPEDANRLYTLHHLISVPLADVIEDVKAFLNDPSSANEFIVLDFQHLYLTDDSDGKGKFFGELDRLSDRFIPVDVPLTTPLEILWRVSSRRRIFLVVGSGEDESPYPAARIRSKCMVSRWVDQGSLSKLLEALDNLLLDDLKYPQTGVPSKLHVTQAVLTPRYSDIFIGIFPKISRRIASSIYDMATRVNPSLLEWFYLLNAKGLLDGMKVMIPSGINTHENILMLDCVELGRCQIMDGTTETNAVGMCVYLNILRASRLFEDSSAAPSLNEG
ncbi:putative glycosylphosphatidylinositol-specific phospholipase C [Trypanosoma cruzi]|uniref:Putative glycosylphosphatidylinositol-specific phospholipase C n=1 Tax=Trypanosoma cruzi TaxID=5693 RepID=A0A2V2XDR1_TRYCR|nr:putative glycosylphosphatidylinositol-specific phospholipase C [Trypanosoma cruzi]